jgi:hypothetical protein
MIALCSTCTLFVAGPALAQAKETASAQPSPVSKNPIVELNFDVTAGYTDNVFATRNHEVDDLLVITRPSARLTFADGQNRMVIRGEGELGRYQDVQSENYDDWLLGVDGRLRASGGLTLLGGAEYQWEHEGRSSPDAEDGLEPTRYGRLYVYGGAIARTGKFTIRPVLQLNRYDFNDVEAAGGSINNDDRDRTQVELGARIAYATANGTELFVQGTRDRREYRERVDDFGFRRDSRGGSLVAGLHKTFSPSLNAEVFAGYLGQDYDDPRLKDVATFDAGMLVNWSGPRGLAATFRLDRSVEETTLPGASAYLVTSGSLTFTATPHPRLQTGLTLTGSKYDYRGDPRAEFVAGSDVWLRYWLNPHIYAGLNYSLSQRTSNAAGFDYDENRLMLRLGADLRRHYAGETDSIIFDDIAPAGLYAGLFGAHGALVTGLDGPRGQGTNTADFGDSGFAGGAMFGYGTTIGNAYLGAELVGEVGGPDWLHVAERVFSVDRGVSIGVAGRAGWLTPARDLLYGRLGLSRTQLRTRYDLFENSYDRKKWHTGMDFGVGTEAAAGARGFVRAEYVLTSYNDIDVPSGMGDDNMSSGEGQFRLGAGIRLGALAKDSAITPTDFGGSYLGVQIGHGALVSRNLGVREKSQAIDIQRAGQGPVAGVFAGIGMTRAGLYVGAEVEAEISGVDWNIERDPNGRIYAAERQYSIGAAARVGWQISKSAMIYGRVGPAWTKFRIPYATTGDSVLSKSTRRGLRMGGGLEVGVGARSRVRLEYTTTGYGEYDVEYGESNSDNFKHRDNIARVGIAWRI